MKSPAKVGLLMSGGLDSAILASWLQKKNIVQPIYCQSGHVWEKAELYWLKRFLNTIRNRRLEPLKILSCPTADLYRTHWSITGEKIPAAKSGDLKVYLPGKNLLLITKAAVYCSLNQIHTLALGPLKTNPFPDAKASFFRNLENVCSAALNFKFKIKTPFLNRTKQEVMALGKNLPLHLTFSCLNPHNPQASYSRAPYRLSARRTPAEFIHCGKCNKCAERKKAFQFITP